MDINLLQQKLIEKEVQKGKSAEQVFNLLTKQRELCSLMMQYEDEVFNRSTFKKSVMVKH